MIDHKRTQHDLLLAAGLQDIILVPDSDVYVDRQASYWAANTPMRPKMIVQPRTAEEVSLSIKALIAADGLVAVRSGGHTQWAGANDINDGITLDLGQMTAVTYEPESKLASIQPGARWTGVYRQLLEHQVCVTGGREGNVGVAGFLTGGGISYYAGLRGLGCDNVANFEIVLGTGEIVNANVGENADLWTALKGGSGNFGIVTRFDMYTFPAHDIWGGLRAARMEDGDGLPQMTVDFTSENHKNPHLAFLLDYTFNKAMSPEPLAAYVVVDTSGTAEAPPLGDILGVPHVIDDVKKRSIADKAAAYNSAPNKHQTWFTLTFKNDVDIIKKASVMHNRLVSELSSLISTSNFTTQCIFQPWPTLFAEHSVRRGGNVLGLDQTRHNALLWLIVGNTETAEEHLVMREKLTAFSSTLEDYAMSNDLNVDWRYLNYVDETQNPLKSYGQDNVKFLKEVAEKYDPDRIFQEKIVSGWKLSKVDCRI